MKRMSILGRTATMVFLFAMLGITLYLRLAFIAMGV